MAFPSIPTVSDSSEDEIPKTVHRIWVGSDVPPGVANNWRLWEEAFPDWTFISWTEETLDDLPAGRRIHEECLSYGMELRGSADFLRIWSVALYGGMYVDSDALPLFSAEEIAELNRHPWFAHLTAPMIQGLPWNGLFNMPARHPILSEIWNYGVLKAQKGLKNPHHITGPQAWRKILDTVDHNVGRPESYYFLTDLTLRRRALKGGLTHADLDVLRRENPELPVAHIGIASKRL